MLCLIHVGEASKWPLYTRQQFRISTFLYSPDSRCKSSCLQRSWPSCCKMCQVDKIAVSLCQDCRNQHTVAWSAGWIQLRHVSIHRTQHLGTVRFVCTHEWVHERRSRRGRERERERERERDRGREGERERERGGGEGENFIKTSQDPNIFLTQYLNSTTTCTPPIQPSMEPKINPTLCSSLWTVICTCSMKLSSYKYFHSHWQPHNTKTLVRILLTSSIDPLFLLQLITCPWSYN